MSYEVIEKNQYGVLVTKIKSLPAECEKCKYTGLAVTLQPCFSCKGDNSYYLPDSEAEKLESEIEDDGYTMDEQIIHSLGKEISDSQKELIDLQLENKKLKDRVNELEDTIENNTTELIKRSGDITHDYWYYCQECLHNFEIDEEFNFCPNCGRKIVR